jgi:hypothetical protein
VTGGLRVDPDDGTGAIAADGIGVVVRDPHRAVCDGDPQRRRAVRRDPCDESVRLRIDPVDSVVVEAGRPDGAVGESDVASPAGTNLRDDADPEQPALGERARPDGAGAVADPRRTLRRRDGERLRNRVVAKIPLGAQEYCCGPDNMVAAFGDIWVDIPNQHLVVRIDARRTRVAARIHVPDGCGQLTVGAGSVWLASGCSPGLLRIDPKTNEIVARIDTLGSPAYPIGYFDGSVWTTTDDLRLLRVDPSSNSVAATTDVAPTNRPEGGGPMFAFGGGSIWISDYDGERVLRFAVPGR